MERYRHAGMRGPTRQRHGLGYVDPARAFRGLQPNTFRGGDRDEWDGRNPPQSEKSLLFAPPTCKTPRPQPLVEGGGVCTHQLRGGDRRAEYPCSLGFERRIAA